MGLLSVFWLRLALHGGGLGIFYTSFSSFTSFTGQAYNGDLLFHDWMYLGGDGRNFTNMDGDLAGESMDGFWKSK